MQERTKFKYRYSKVEIFILVLIITATIISWSYMASMGDDNMESMTMDMNNYDPAMESAMETRALVGITRVSLPSMAMFISMWAVMCISMMLPTAIPMVLCLGRISLRRIQEEGGSQVSVYQRPVLFTIGYIVCWCVFGVIVWAVAYLLFALIGDWLNIEWKNLWAGISILFLMGGIYQVSPLKYACLYGCQHPLVFLMKHWRKSLPGAFVMGLRHAFDCIGCCVALMIVMMPLGMMNLVWMAIFTLIMFFEKDARIGKVLSQVVGWLFIIAGIIGLGIVLLCILI